VKQILTLVDLASKKVIYTNTIVSNTAYSATAGTYPTAIAERDANVRLSRDMADKIVTLLLISAKDWIEMKLVGDKANNYFTNPDTSHTAILIYGADTMRVALRRQELLKALIGDNAEEEMRLTRISGSDLRSDPALLLDGLKASGFFPGLRAVFVEGATDTNSAVIDAAMQDWQMGDAILVLTSYQLNARSKLRKLIENNSNSVAIGIYNDPPNEKGNYFNCLKTQPY
jgi:hypothetical protein